MFTSRLITYTIVTIFRLFLIFPLLALADQVADPDYVPYVPNPAYTSSPIVLFDHGHNNFQRVDGRADGYNVRAIDGPFTLADPVTGAPC